MSAFLKLQDLTFFFFLLSGIITPLLFFFSYTLVHEVSGKQRNVGNVTNVVTLSLENYISIAFKFNRLFLLNVILPDFIQISLPKYGRFRQIFFSSGPSDWEWCKWALIDLKPPDTLPVQMKVIYKYRYLAAPVQMQTSYARLQIRKGRSHFKICAR